jgi:hypothetical protein
MRALPITVTALAAALLLTACGGGSDSDSSGHDDTGSKNTDGAPCRIGELGLRAGPANAAPAAGDTGDVPVTLTNRGGTCSLDGFPGVTVGVASTSATVPADRNSTPRKLTLAEGDTATFTLTYVRGEEGDGKSLAATSLRIGLPGETAETRSFTWSYGPVRGKKGAGDPDASVTAFQLAGD